MSAPAPLAVFCDFDGTVARRDVGYNLFHHFSGGRNDALLPDWKAGRLSTRDCLLQEAEMVHAPAEEILAFLDRFDLDPTFAPFVARCRAADVTLKIVSEGLDLYINRVLSRAGLTDLPVISNVGVFENGRLRIEFPYQNRRCRRCGNCKGERIDEYRESLGTPVVVACAGDGYSDACAAHAADLLFAKDDLERYCQRDNISYNRFTDFDDVAEALARMGHLSS
jgi:2-hydroxy-3-keto-5-methylthiopentenyl-1-phosphate phosphatase